MGTTSRLETQSPREYMWDLEMPIVPQERRHASLWFIQCINGKQFNVSFKMSSLNFTLPLEYWHYFIRS